MRVFSESLSAGSQGSAGARGLLANYVVFFTKSRYLIALSNSLKVVVLSTFFGALLAIPLAYLLARYAFKGKSIILTLITMATAAPPFLGAYSWVMLTGRYGALNRLIFWLTHVDVPIQLRGEAGVIWVITWLVFPMILLLSYDSFCAGDVSHREASMGLGASRFKTFWKIELPLAAPGIVTGLLMAALSAFSDFGTPSIIGGEYPVMPTLVYGEFVSEMGGNLSMASTAGIIMVVISTIALVGQRLSLAGKSFASVATPKAAPMLPGKGLKIATLLLAGTVIVISFLPHVTLLVVSLMKWKWGVLIPSFTMDNYVHLFQDNLSPVAVSFFLGTTATVLDIVFGVGIAYVIVKNKYKTISGFLNFTFMIPYVIPGIVFAVGFIIQFNQPPLVLTGTWMILVLVFFIRKLPYSVKSAEAALYQIHPALEEAAMMCGARPYTAFKDVTFKLMVGGIITGATLSFLQIMTELSTTIILYRIPWVTMPVIIFQYAMTSGADFGISAAMGVLLMVCIYVPLAVINSRSRQTTFGGGF